MPPTPFAQRLPPTAFAQRFPEVCSRRLRGLDARAAGALRVAAQSLSRGAAAEAELRLFSLGAIAPQHPEISLWHARALAQLGRDAESEALLVALREQCPDDPQTWLESAHLALAGEHSALGARYLARALELADRDPWLLDQAMRLADAQGLHAAALHAADCLIACRAPGSAAQMSRARALTALGRTADAAASWRQMIATKRSPERAYWSLTDLKTERLDDAEFGQLSTLVERSTAPAFERALAWFAFGQAAEHRGAWAVAYAALLKANALVRALEPWDPPAFFGQLDAIAAAFAAPDAAPDSGFGREVIFIVGLPRSGSTLVEQVLAAHPEVEAASELPSLGQVIAEESARRGCAFPVWVADASPADWRRLGQRYLALTARWRQRRPRATDKLPENWLYVGAIRAMLPGARIIDCRRDPLEMLWSCWRQRFAPGRVSWAQDFAWAADYWHGYTRLAAQWSALHPMHYRTQSLEALLADPQTQMRGLLDSLDLRFDQACLQPHLADRAVRTASAAQVRQPMRMPASRSAQYGDLLDPLRAEIARVAMAQ